MSARAWALLRALALGAVVMALSPLSPLVLVLVPMAVQLLAFRRGDRWGLALALFVLVVAFAGLVQGRQEPMW
ncbi:MAG TPA: hypothetical protein VKA44_05365, partial [Gemmatimonadota bacterium]|nr:hypothetical protein [Gemmatimonadota bacterium]